MVILRYSDWSHFPILLGPIKPGLGGSQEVGFNPKKPQYSFV